MSNPAVCLLKEGTINNIRIRVEDNIGEAVHIHIGDIRLSLSTSEFYELCNAIEEAATELFSIEGLDWNSLDLSALDWNWVTDYEKIKEFRIENVRLEDLYTIRHIAQNGQLYRVVKLKDSLFVDELINGDGKEISLYREENYFDDNPKQRLGRVNELIKSNNYPYDGKYIMVDENRMIYDGDHRAAALYVRYGGDYQIPVMVIVKKGENESIDELITYHEKLIVKYKFKQLVKKVISVIKLPLRFGRSILKRRYTEKRSGEILFYRNIIDSLDRRKIPYYVIDHELVNDERKTVKTIVVDKYSEVFSMYECSAISAYNDYNFLYSTSHPLMLNTNEGFIIIWDRLCCKSRFEKAILPMDRFINNYAWSAFGGLDQRAQQMVVLIYVITSSMLEKGVFDKNDIKLIEGNYQLLQSDVFREMLEKEFFGYAKEIIERLNERDYTACVEGYIKYVDY